MEKRKSSTKVIAPNASISPDGLLNGIKILVSYTCSLNSEDAKEGTFAQVSDMTVDLAGVHINTLVADAWAHKKVAMQGPDRDSDYDSIEAKSGTTLMYNEAGRKVKTRSQRVAEYEAMGFPRTVAEMAADDPAAFNVKFQKFLETEAE
ncbi:MAG: hypothetical protein KAS32_10985 [Candidatus Peribacteraceae bacterium]|nr:hypothetical protein [Candidatus Peribacteraceae bacterium]